jgi:hypothetical protein
VETTERIVEAYVRYIKGWATIPNIKCQGQYEIDLIAIDPLTGDRYHIESGISVSGSFSKLTNKPYGDDLIKIRVKQAGQRRTVGYFEERKFRAPEVLGTLESYGFKSGRYKKVVVSWGWTNEAEAEARRLGIELWHFPDLLAEITRTIADKRTYFTDDTLRTLQLYAMAIRSHPE